MGLLGFRRQELVGLAVNLHQGPAVTWIDFVPGESTEFNLHFDFCKGKQVKSLEHETNLTKIYGKVKINYTKNNYIDV